MDPKTGEVGGDEISHEKQCAYIQNQFIRRKRQSEDLLEWKDLMA